MKKGKTSFALLLALLLAACGSAPPRPIEPLQPQQRPVAHKQATLKNENKPAERAIRQSQPNGEQAQNELLAIQSKELTIPGMPPPSSPEDHFFVASRALARGYESLARIHLQAILKLTPGDMKAAILLRQIDQPVGQFFKQRYGERHFDYVTRESDTLFSVARAFLQDEYLYYSLGKFNRIRALDGLQAGQTIRIPGERPADRAPEHRETEGGKRNTPPQNNLQVIEPDHILARKQRDSAQERIAETPVPAESRESSDYRAAKDYFKQKRYLAAIEILESSSSKKDKRSAAVLASAYSEQAKTCEQNDDLTTARDYLDRASKLQPGDKELETRLRDIQRTVDVRSYLASAQLHVKKERWAEAYVALREVLKRDPDHGPASKEFQRIKAWVVDKPYHDCMVAYGLREFAKAMDLCGNVLRLEPDHELAKLQLDKAHDMVKKLNGLAAGAKDDKPDPRQASESGF